MLYLAVIAGLLAATFWGVSDYLGGNISRKIGQYRTTAYLSVFNTAVVFPVMLFFGINLGISHWILFLAIVTSVAMFAAALFMYKAYRFGSLSITAPIVNSYPSLVVLGAVFILGVAITKIEVISIAAILIGIVLLSIRKSALKNGARITALGTGSAVIALVLYAAAFIFAGAYAKVIGFALLTFIWDVTSIPLGFAALFAMKQKIIVKMSKKMIAAVVVPGAFLGFGMLSFMYPLFASGEVDLPIVSTLASFAGGVTVICALLFLRERPETNQWIGMVMAIVGVMVLSYFS